MNTIATYFPQMDLRLAGIEAAGNSEGAKLGWDKRGRGRKMAQGLSKSMVRGAPAIGTKLNKKVANWARRSYEAIKLDEEAVKSISKKTSAKGILLKHAWFAKRLGDLMQSWEGFSELAKVVYKTAKKLAETAVGIGGVAEVTHVLHAAVLHLAPVLHHIAQVAMQTGGSLF